MNFIVILIVAIIGINILGSIVKMNLSALFGWASAMFLLFNNSPL